MANYYPNYNPNSSSAPASNIYIGKDSIPITIGSLITFGQSAIVYEVLSIDSNKHSASVLALISLRPYSVNLASVGSGIFTIISASDWMNFKKYGGILYVPRDKVTDDKFELIRRHINRSHRNWTTGKSYECRIAIENPTRNPNKLSEEIKNALGICSTRDGEYDRLIQQAIDNRKYQEAMYYTVDVYDKHRSDSVTAIGQAILFKPLDSLKDIKPFTDEDVVNITLDSEITNII